MSMRFYMEFARRGGTLIYCMVMMTALCGIASLAVDLGRVQLAKTELQRCADAAARASAQELSTSLVSLQSVAQQYASANLVDGSAVTLDTTNDIEIGTWDSPTKTFTTAAFGSANAVRITARRTAARGNAIPLTFAKVLGRNSCDVTAVAIASASSSALYVHGNYNLYRAGNSGNAPGHDPAKFSGNVNPGHKFTFNDLIDAATLSGYGADGNSGNVLTLPAMNGISGISAPQGALIGVFLDDNDPSQYTAPASLDFSNNGKRNFTTISPLLRQTFFIGDGARVSANDQFIVVPAGATRLYFGVVDSSWGTDWGSFSVSPTDSSGGGAISIVK